MQKKHDYYGDRWLKGYVSSVSKYMILLLI